MAKLTDIHVRDCMQSITLRVRGLKGLGWRIWAAGKVFRFAGWVLRTPVELEIGETDKREIRRLRLRPGDVLVARYWRTMSANEAAQIKDHFRQVFDDVGLAGVKMILVDSSVSLDVLSRFAGAGFQPLSGGRAPDNPPNVGSSGKKPLVAAPISGQVAERLARNWQESAARGETVILGDGLKYEPTPQLKEMRAALIDCIEAMDNSAPCFDDYWDARRRAAKAAGVPE